jgi:hypothetical protein
MGITVKKKGEESPHRHVGEHLRVGKPERAGV